MDLPAAERAATLVVDTVAVGDEAPVLAFEAMYEREYAGLVAVAIAMTGDRDGAPDLVHDTMVKALVRWDRVSRLDRPGAWCHHVLLNACRSSLRRRTTQWRYLARQRREERTTPAPSTEALVFWDVVRTLPSRPRAVVALRFGADLTSIQIAEMLDVPEGTVRSDLAMARKAVMGALREDTDG